MKSQQLRSFSRRIGKTLSNLQENLLSNDLPKFIYSKERFEQISKNYDSVCIEVGIGMAEHFVNQAKLNPSKLFIGVEPYLNGIANCLKIAGPQKVENFMLWPDDADLILPNFAEGSIQNFYLLFPDPWPKLKQKKRRFASQNRIKLIKNLLCTCGHFIFASDIIDYAENVKSECLAMGFRLSSSSKHDGYVLTKFHTKAIESGREPIFMTLQK